jgi:dTMP kinase
VRGRFVVFEGIDGSGKSSTLNLVASTLAKEGIALVATKEETDSVRGGWIRESIQANWDPLATTFLFAADRAVHVKEIEAWRSEGKHVLCDRFMHSTLAYQSVTLNGRMPEPAAFLERMHEGWCPKPDYVLLFKADPAKCVERVKRRGQTAAYEKQQFLAKVQDAYLALAAKDPRFTVLDSERDISAVGADALVLVRKWLS